MSVRILIGDCLDKLRELPDESVHCVVTSPPYYGLRDYGVAGQIGLEQTPQEFIAKLVEVFREVRRVLRSDGTCWVNMGDSYNAHPGQRKIGDKVGAKQETNVGAGTIGSRSVEGIKPKDLLGIPWMLAFALRADGWYLRQDIVWSKPNPMPESVTDRCTKAHEYIFLLSKSERYFYDGEAIAEQSVGTDYDKTKRAANRMQGAPSLVEGRGQLVAGASLGVGTETRNKRSVWNVTTSSYSEAHFATFPPKLIEPCILAGCPSDGTVLDPFGGAGTTGLVADRLGRNAILLELNPAYAEMARKRIFADSPLFAEVAA